MSLGAGGDSQRQGDWDAPPAAPTPDLSPLSRPAPPGGSGERGAERGREVKVAAMQLCACRGQGRARDVCRPPPARPGPALADGIQTGGPWRRPSPPGSLSSSVSSPPLCGPQCWGHTTLCSRNTPGALGRPAPGSGSEPGPGVPASPPSGFQTDTERSLSHLSAAPQKAASFTHDTSHSGSGSEAVGSQLPRRLSHLSA